MFALLTEARDINVSHSHQSTVLFDLAGVRPTDGLAHCKHSFFAHSYLETAIELRKLCPALSLLAV